jgi:adenosylhomocysteine nucleosidase
MIAVSFALSQESSEFLRCLRNKSRTERNDVEVIRGNIDDQEIEVFHTGVGEKICRERVAKVLQSQQFELLISSGFAGALDDQLEVGDLLVAENFSTIDPDNRRLSFSELRIRTGNLLTVPVLIDSSDERRRIARTSGAAAVDMETEFVARACAAHGIPLLSLRVITDTPQKPFPAPPKILFDIECQRTHALKFATFFLANPHRAPRLVQFARRISQAREILANALVRLVREL